MLNGCGWDSRVSSYMINTLRPRQNGRHFPDDIFKCIFLNENVSISNIISLKFISKGPINNIPALIQIMARRRPGDKPISEQMMVSLLTHICVTRQCTRLWTANTVTGCEVWELLWTQVLKSKCELLLNYHFLCVIVLIYREYETSIEIWAWISNYIHIEKGRVWLLAHSLKHRWS